MINFNKFQIEKGVNFLQKWYFKNLLNIINVAQGGIKRQARKQESRHNVKYTGDKIIIKKGNKIIKDYTEYNTVREFVRRVCNSCNIALPVPWCARWHDNFMSFVFFMKFSSFLIHVFCVSPLMLQQIVLTLFCHAFCACIKFRVLIK